MKVTEEKRQELHNWIQSVLEDEDKIALEHTLFCECDWMIRRLEEKVNNRAIAMNRESGKLMITSPSFKKLPPEEQMVLIHELQSGRSSKVLPHIKSHPSYENRRQKVERKLKTGIPNLQAEIVKHSRGTKPVRDSSGKILHGKYEVTENDKESVKSLKKTLANYEQELKDLPNRKF